MRNSELVECNKGLQGDLMELRELNSNDICEINKLKWEIEQSSKNTDGMRADEDKTIKQIQFEEDKIVSMENKIE